MKVFQRLTNPRKHQVLYWLLVIPDIIITAMLSPIWIPLGVFLYLCGVRSQEEWTKLPGGRWIRTETRTLGDSVVNQRIRVYDDQGYEID